MENQLAIGISSWVVGWWDMQVDLFAQGLHCGSNTIACGFILGDIWWGKNDIIYWGKNGYLKYIMKVGDF